MVRKFLMSAAAVATIGALSVPAMAAPCKDPKGRFIKCPEAKKPPVRCKDGRGKFIKCGSPGAKPV